MDISQIILLVVILLVSVVLIIIGIQLIFILKDTKKTLSKVDNILGDVEFMSRNLTRSSLTVGHLVDSVRNGLELAGVATKALSSLTSKKQS
jgi:L-asparagine transporter-like permease